MNSLKLKLSRHLYNIGFLTAVISTKYDYCLILFYQPDVPNELKIYNFTLKDLLWSYVFVTTKTILLTILKRF